MQNINWNIRDGKTLYIQFYLNSTLVPRFVVEYFYLWVQNKTLLAAVHVVANYWILNQEEDYIIFLFCDGLASRAGESSELLIDSQGSSVQLTTKLSNAAQMASILLKVIIHLNVAAAWLRADCSSPSHDLSLDTKKVTCPPADAQQSALYSRCRLNYRSTPLALPDWTKEREL